METLALIEVLDRDGLPRQALRVSAWFGIEGLLGRDSAGASARHQ